VSLSKILISAAAAQLAEGLEKDLRDDWEAFGRIERKPNQTLSSFRLKKKLYIELYDN